MLKVRKREQMMNVVWMEGSYMFVAVLEVKLDCSAP